MLADYSDKYHFSVLTSWRHLSGPLLSLHSGLLSTIPPTFSWVGYAGVITGAGEHLTDSEKDAAIRAGRWAPYSVKLGDRWVSYRGWGPPAGLLSLASNMVEKHKAGG